jgi:hypothetical protein
MDYLLIGTHALTILLCQILIWQYFKGSKALKLILSVVVFIIFTFYSVMIFRSGKARNKNLQ